MFQQLYEFLILHGKLALPEIGVILLERNAASVDTANKTFNNPEWEFKFKDKKEPTDRDLYSWLSRVFDISTTDAIVKLTDFSFDFKNKLNSGETVNWEGIGHFKKGLGEEIKFTAVKNEFDYIKPIVAEKVIREKASHSVRVGDVERSSEEMEEMLNRARGRKVGPWIYALIAVVAALSFLVLHFVKNDMKFSSFQNQQKLSAKELPSILK
jgi:hypothetical protein